MSLAGAGSFNSPQSRNSKEKEFMVLPRSGFGGLHWKAQSQSLDKDAGICLWRTALLCAAG